LSILRQADSLKKCGLRPDFFSIAQEPTCKVSLDPKSAVTGQMMISIVVPTFRRNAMLPPLFAAVAAEVGSVSKPVELVLVDNAPERSAEGVAATAPAFVRYVHEPLTGVARARNRGVREARGTHVIFLDDDELPEPGWLSAFALMAAHGAPAAFGSIEPAFDMSPPDVLLSPLDRIFSRRLPASTGQDVSHLRAYLGSGNSMFRRDVLLLEDPPFDPAFDGGGEDVALFLKLVDNHGVALIWCPEARVREVVPGNRATLAFLRARRFSDGQLRCLVERQAGGWRGWLRPLVWMVVGGGQLVLHGVAALVARPFSKAQSTRFQLAAIGGAGKLWWWRRKLTR